MRTLLKTMLLCMLAACWLSGSASPGQCSEITKSWQDDDKRLLTPVTFSASSMYLGELLEKLAKQTGVSIAADDHEAGSGTLITVHWTQVPLADALNSLWSLLSYQSAEWTWEKSTAKEGSVYRLLRPGAAREFGAYVRSLVMKVFAEQAALLSAAANKSLEERKQLAKKHPELQDLFENDEHIQRLRFYAALPEKTQQEVLTSPDGVQIEVKDLRPDLQQFLMAEWKTAGEYTYYINTEGQTTTVPVPPPTWVRLQARLYNDSFTPTLFLDESTGFGAGLVGGRDLENGLKTKLEALWLLPGDTKHEDIEARQLPKSKEAEFTEVLNHHNGTRDLPEADIKRLAEIGEHKVTYRLTQIAEAVPLSYTARLGQAQRGSSAYNTSTSGLRLQDCLHRLRDGKPDLLYKWRDSLLLLSDCAWYHNDASAPTPYEIISALRTAEKTNGGFVPLRSLAMAAERLTPEQLKELATEFPVLTNVASMQDVFRMYYHDAGWERTGTALTPTIVEALSKLPGSLNTSGRKGHLSATSGKLMVFDATPIGPLADDLKNPLAGTVRLVELRDKQTPSQRQIEVQLLTADGTVTARYGFFVQQRETKSEAIRH